MSAKVIIMAATAAAERLRSAVTAAGASVEDLADAILDIGKAHGLSHEQIAFRFQKPDDLIILSPSP
jgi:hypothetical protein